MKFRHATICTVVVLVTGLHAAPLVPPPPAPAAPTQVQFAPATAQQRTSEFAEIRRQLGTRPQVPVIVQFAVPNIEQLTTRSLQATQRHVSAVTDAELRDAIHTNISAHLAKLAGTSHVVHRVFDYIPFAALTVSPEALDALDALPAALGVQEDRLSFPTLDATAELVRADYGWTHGGTGAGYRVAVLDTGIRSTHNFFAGKSIVQGCFSRGEDGASGAGDCPNGNSTDTTSANAARHFPTNPTSDHGSHVAGIAVGNDPTRTPPIYGVARGADLIAVQVFSQFTDDPGCGCPTCDCVASWDSDSTAALNFVYGLRTTYAIASVNMSLGGGQYFDEVTCDSANFSKKSVINNLRNAGIATIIATGNDGFCGSIASPGCISNAVAVGGTFDASAEWPGSNYHSTMVELFAPATIVNSSVGTSNSAYDQYTGTSMATPHVAGAFAILKQLDPAATVSSLVSILQSTGDPVDGFCTPSPTQRRIRIDRAAAGGDVGACCHDDTCTIESNADCTTLSGDYLDNDTLCADSSASAAFSYEAFPGSAIPDGGAFSSSAVNTFNVTQNVPVERVSVEVQVNHTWVGELLARVTHGSYNVIVYSADPGCDANNFNVALDDDAIGGPIDLQCADNLASPPAYTPGESLSPFYGLSSSGTWQIRVGDFSGGDTGTLVRWKLTIEPQQLPCNPVLYVNANATGLKTGMDWANAFVDLQDALDFATGMSSQQIWVASAGGFDYLPDRGTGNRNLPFVMKPNVAIYGGFVGTETALEQRDPLGNPTILSGDLNGDDTASFGNRTDNSYHVVDGSNGNATSLVDGFTIQGANADGVVRGFGGITDRGGAIYLAGGTLGVNNCRLTDNFALTGGAIACEGGATIDVSNSILVANAADDAGAVRIDAASGSFTNSKLFGNTATSGAAGGALLTNSAAGQFVNCAFAGNTAATQGGAVSQDALSTSSWTNCTFGEHSATTGGALYLSDSGGAATAALRNCVVWNTNLAPTGPQIHLDGAPSITVEYSNVLGGFAGPGNIDADPLFVDADGADNSLGTDDDDLSINTGSPCVDAADSTAPDLTGVLTDLVGNPRFVDDLLVADTGNGAAPIVDIGAYELQVPQCQIEGQPCDDGDYCTVDDICTGGICGGDPRVCDDANICTSDLCNSALATCQFAPAPGPCDDNNFCTVNDACENGICDGDSQSCDDTNVCTSDSCSTILQMCVFTPIGGSCNDNDACTSDDACAGGLCLGDPLDCDDTNPCTDDSCNSATGCVHDNNTAVCDDGDPCTIGNCADGQCGVYTHQEYADLFTPLDGVVDVDDLICLLEAFANGLTACPLADIEPCVADDGDVDVDDLIAMLEAFTGNQLCPDPCP